MSLLLDSSYKDVIEGELFSCKEMLSKDNSLDYFDVVVTRMAGISECFSDKDLELFFRIMHDSSRLKASEKTIEHLMVVIDILIEAILSGNIEKRKDLKAAVVALDLMAVFEKKDYGLSEEEKPVFLSEMSMLTSVLEEQAMKSSHEFDEGSLFECYKAAHTLKGFGGMVRDDLMYVVSEYMEKMYAFLKDKKLDMNNDAISLLNCYVDFLKNTYEMVGLEKKKKRDMSNFISIAETINLKSSVLSGLCDKILSLGA